MADFTAAYKAVRTVEGGYANDPDDPGKRTYAGISEKNWPSWSGWIIINSYDKQGMTRAALNAALSAHSILQQDVLDFYEENFWNKMRLTEIANQNIAAELFDTGVNMGVPVSGGFIQRCLNAFSYKQNYQPLKVDGVIGAATIAATNGHPQPKVIYKALNCLQGEKYIELSEHNNILRKYMLSWYARVF